MLTEHFIQRLFATEQEQGASSFGVGFSALIAILAAPGAFASVLLIDKYSTLLSWLRGHRLNGIPQSPSDEYFFVVLSMTITGLVMIARWNRLFPDRRDFANLAILPLPPAHIFLSNLVALLAMAAVLGVVVNGVSAIIFPLFVTISVSTVAALVRVGLAHAATVFSASLFSFFAVFAFTGALMVAVPQRLFRVVSIAARILLLVALLSEFVIDATSQISLTSLPASAAWLPSLWYLGIYERMAGIANPPVTALGQRAWIALAAAIVVSLAAYAVCYRRIFARLPESFDMLVASRAFFRIRLPDRAFWPLFRSPTERAAIAFATRVLLRSEPHLMFFGAYLGIGLVIVAENLWSSPASAPLLIAFFIVSGLRMVFEIPASSDANWIFRTALERVNPAPEQIARWMILWAALPWQIVLFLPLAGYFVDLRNALLETALNVLLTALFTDVLLLRFPKIPFTCLTQLDVRQLIHRMLLSVFGVVVVLPLIAGAEAWLIGSLTRFVPALLLLSLGIYRLRRRALCDGILIYEDKPSSFELLKLA